MAGHRIPGRGVGLFPVDRHHPVRVRGPAHRVVRILAVRQDDRRQAERRDGALLGNVIWVLLFGIWLAIGHLVSAVAMAATIIGIPLALANLKLIPVSLVPLGKEIVPVGAPARIERVTA
ncbi:hypothetical protein I547_5891 [Mycobacterium kansasii 824]|nr:hypothetical protein I547_5891 [Mycobacterium kansasii 824]